MVPFAVSARYGRAARISGALAAGCAALAMTIAPRGGAARRPVRD
jgi:hypothetical protein